MDDQKMEGKLLIVFQSNPAAGNSLLVVSETLNSVSELGNQVCISLGKRQYDLANIYKGNTRVT